MGATTQFIKFMMYDNAFQHDEVRVPLPYFNAIRNNDRTFLNKNYSLLHDRQTTCLFIVATVFREAECGSLA